ncbi:SseB family protein [Cellulomonas sp. PS-H5]|uniref:SseB family protein n=1 Tax=Cellulomonas sp. PS-H5 TaxID=2820400 RepID=UPI001C4F37D1|nr:SseB family protein [Cellulomonas sp. PS-H5]MBW0256154.1 SseB family protein [Cellulomonas sp. PS-H5]
MGLFSRRSREPEPDEPEAGAEPDPAPPAAPLAGEPGPGVRHDRVREALGAWAERKDARTFADVLRRAVSGELLLDVTDSRLADPERGFQQGDTLAIASIRDNAGADLLVAFTGHDELQRMRQAAGRSLVQPAAAVLAQAVRDHQGIVVDGRAPGAFIVYAAEIRQHLTEEPEAVARLTEATTTRSLPFAQYVEALGAGPLFVPVATDPDDGPAGPAATGPDGGAYTVVGTSPAEVWAWRPGGAVRRAALAEIAAATLGAGRAGIVVNPAGPPVVVPAAALPR